MLLSYITLFVYLFLKGIIYYHFRNGYISTLILSIKEYYLMYYCVI